MSVAPAAARPQRTFLGHPIGLYVLFFTEMWERFSYYGMRALLVVYMTNGFKWLHKDASEIYKMYTTLVYVTPIIGGFLADRFLGNRRAVIIGGVLMAIGHFLMAYEAVNIFYTALIFLIIGNGFFKPNMSTQVGRLYPAGDGRLDGAYTIFYMGINLGALLSPLICGWLALNTMGGYHTGFTMAGIGMVLGLVVYLLGQPFIREVASETTSGTPATDAAKKVEATAKEGDQHDRALTEEEAARQPSNLGIFSGIIPWVLLVVGVLCLIASPFMIRLEKAYQITSPFTIHLKKGPLVDIRLTAWAAQLSLFDGLMLAIVGGCLVIMARIAWSVSMGLRDRVIAILVLGIFVVFFWAAGEQAGNVLSVWADKNTDRYLTEEAPAVAKDVDEPEPLPADLTGGFWNRIVKMFTLKPRPQTSWKDWLSGIINPISTESFQSINPTAIVILAPLFAWLWIRLDRRGLQPSIPLKMAIGLMLVTASMGVMVAAAKKENQTTSVVMNGELPASFKLVDGNKIAVRNLKSGVVEPVRAGRLLFDPASHTLIVYGVLSDNERDHVVSDSAPETFREKIKQLQDESAKIDDNVKEVSVQFKDVPAGFDKRYAALKLSDVTWNNETKTLVAKKELTEKQILALKLAASDDAFRNSMNALMVDSAHFKVSAGWLFWSYILVTMGELCLSPVGLSMVSKLAPARSSTMLMGMWMLTSAFGNFAAARLGEDYTSITPTNFFWLATIIVGASSVVLVLISHFVVKIMHGVK